MDVVQRRHQMVAGVLAPRLAQRAGRGGPDAPVPILAQRRRQGRHRVGIGAIGQGARGGHAIDRQPSGGELAAPERRGSCRA